MTPRMDRRRSSGSSAPKSGAQLGAPPGPEDPEPATELPNNAWEDRDARGGLRAFGQTVRALLVEPRAFFGATSERRAMAGPFVFGLTASLLGQIAEAGLVAAGLAFLPEGWHEQALESSETGFGWGILPQLPSELLSFLGCQAAILSIPLIFLATAATLVLAAVFNHLGLVVAGGARDSEVGFRGTFVVSCYASAAALLQVVPLLGDLLYLTGMVAITILGLEVFHRTNRARAAIAALTPVIVAGAMILFVARRLA